MPTTTTLDAGREMDAMVAEQVMGWRLEQNHGSAGGMLWHGHGGGFGAMPEGEQPYFSTEIAEAWRVVERMSALGWLWDLDTYSDGQGWHAVVQRPEPDDLRIGSGYGPAPVAICLAALAAITGASQGGER
jgi:hypothetical protein